MGARKAQSARAWPKRAGQQRSVRRQKERTWPSPPATATFVRSGLQRASVPACGQQCPLRVAHSEPKLALLGELRELAAAPMLRLADLCPALLRLADVVPLCAVITQHPSLLELLGEPLQKRVEALVLAQLDMNRLRHLTSHPFGAPGLARNTVPAHPDILPHIVCSCTLPLGLRPLHLVLFCVAGSSYIDMIRTVRYEGSVSERRRCQTTESRQARACNSADTASMMSSTGSSRTWKPANTVAIWCTAGKSSVSITA